MELKTKQRNLPGLVTDINKNKYNFNHPLQRPKNQWSTLSKSELIDSVLRDYSINPVTIVLSMIDDTTGESKELNNAVIDGVQRMTTFAAFFNNEFKISKNLDDEPFVISGITYHPSEYLYGKKYEDLDEKIKDKLDSYDLTLNIFSGVTEKEIRGLFKRKNSGKPLTNAQKNSVNISDELFSQIRSILNADGYTYEVEKKNRAGEVVMRNGKPVMKEKKMPNLWERIFSVGIFKNSEDRNLILEIMMLVSGYSKEHEFGFRNEDIQAFISWFDEQENKQEVIELIINAADSINHRITEKIPNLKKTSIPIFVAGMCKVIKYKGGKDKYMVLAKEFFNSYEQNDEYRNLCGSGSAAKENVQARWEVFKNMAKNC
ncbi:hypothetical protein ADH76_00040 [Enterocloster clostridioformis]|nr:hypothetical protein A4V08_04350 [Lachnoclostridium sp. YL32]NDO27452.1 DUF262 domain-containing protein [Enterocloster clostridioformis]OXE69916.1 hypothetical protein ADH76_00040 [Enterocloster clostridioformis]QQR00063.1 DUF262 domain-containing protein [Enterocloster clostridioformis]